MGAGNFGMGMLMNIFKRKQKPDKKDFKDVRVTVVGLDNSGKTTILRAIAQEDIQSVMPTQGFNVK